VGLVAGEQLYEIAECVPLLVCGTAFAYRLRVNAPVWH
jgi:hypothetical protein